jgi:hypothetical protein
VQGKTSGLTAGQEPAVCELPQEIPEPVNACGVKPVGGLVQQQQLAWGVAGVLFAIRFFRWEPQTD